MKERRDKGLYYNCDDTWGPNHKYSKPMLFLLKGVDFGMNEAVWEEDHGVNGNRKEEIPIEELEVVESREISLHAITRAPAPKIIRVICSIG